MKLGRKARKLIKAAGNASFPGVRMHPDILDRWEGARCPECGGVNVVILERAWPFELAQCSDCSRPE